MLFRSLVAHDVRVLSPAPQAVQLGRIAAQSLGATTEHWSAARDPATSHAIRSEWIAHITGIGSQGALRAPGYPCGGFHGERADRSQCLKDVIGSYRRGCVANDKTKYRTVRLRRRFERQIEHGVADIEGADALLREPGDLH